MTRDEAIETAVKALERAKELLMATSLFIESNPIGEYEVYYDGASCDGSCLQGDSKAAADRIAAAISALRAASDWQPIGDQHKDGKKWLVYGRKKSGGEYVAISNVYLNRGFGPLYGRWTVTFSGGFLAPTHAMPLPSPPKEGE